MVVQNLKMATELGSISALEVRDCNFCSARCLHFAVLANSSGLLVKINMVDINRQAKMYSQGMAPVYRIVPGKPHWERVRDKPTYAVSSICMRFESNF